ncbi:hypothetical protein JST97_20060 [bacterium]|nr:hypothetical protein [bacterium]
MQLLKSRHHLKQVFIGALALYVSGCCNLDAYKNFAKSGIAHSEKVEKAIAVAETVQVDATSWKLLGLDRLSPVDDKMYLSKAQIDRDRLELYAKLREHNALLKAYFSALSDLVNSDAPEQGGKALDGLAAQVGELGKELRGNPFFKDEGGLIGKIGQAIFRAELCGALRDHFEQHAKSLEIEVATQELLCAALAKSAKSDFLDAGQQREAVQILPELQSEKAVEKPEDWVKKRAEIYQLYKPNSDLQQASASAKGLRAQFDAIAGKQN